MATIYFHEELNTKIYLVKSSRFCAKQNSEILLSDFVKYKMH
jgi:hypothetical protein